MQQQFLHQEIPPNRCRSDHITHECLLFVHVNCKLIRDPLEVQGDFLRAALIVEPAAGAVHAVDPVGGGHQIRGFAGVDGDVIHGEVKGLAIQVADALLAEDVAVALTILPGTQDQVAGALQLFAQHLCLFLEIV